MRVINSILIYILSLTAINCLFLFNPKSLRTASTHLNKYDLYPLNSAVSNNDYNTKTFKDILLDKNLSDEVKSFIIDLNEKVRNSEYAIMESDNAKLEVEKENEYLKHKISNITTITQAMTTSFNQLIPRAVIEYVEKWIMTDELYGRLKNRVARWEYFFKSDVIGQDIFDCALKVNPMWEKSALKIADRVNGFYQFNSDEYHSSSHDIATKSKPFILDKFVMNAQMFQFFICVSKKLGLKFVVKETNEIEEL